MSKIFNKLSSIYIAKKPYILLLNNVQYIHCAKKNLNLWIKTKPVTSGADATIYVPMYISYAWILGKERVASPPCVTVFLCRDSNYFGTV